MGITWTDVRAQIPQALIAENAEAGSRRVKARLRIDRASAKPYQCTFTLWDGEERADTWEREYGGRRGFTSAIQGYYQRKEASERWLQGEWIGSVKGKGW